MKVLLISILLIVGWTGFVRSAESKPSQQKLSLGNISLGETLNDFQTQFPKAECGSSLYAAEVALADVPNKGALIGCCLDRPMYVWRFTLHHILPAASCHVLATFYDSRLITLRYVVDVPSIESLLPEIIKANGPATFDGIVPLNPSDPQRVAAWIYGDETLNLSTIVLSNERPDETAVLVQLWKPAPSKPIQRR
jgi:hypothetical protein